MVHAILRELADSGTDTLRALGRYALFAGRLAAETLELPTSRYAFAASVTELKEAIDGGIGYPCIIKPVMSSSGKGQSLRAIAKALGRSEESTKDRAKADGLKLTKLH